jgi:nitrogen fixation NifU-like protein
VTELYNDTVLDHFRHPRNTGVLEGAEAVGKAVNSACGDVLHLYLQIEDDHVRAARFQTFGCAAAIAAGSCLTEMVTGRTLDELRGLRRQDVVDALGGLPPMKVHCSVLAEDAIRAALEDFGKRRPSAQS